MGEIGQFLADWLSALWMILAESGPFLLVGFAIAGILAIVIPTQWIARRLGGDDVKSVATAAIIGVPVPLCSCSVIPTATQLRRSGAAKGATTSFLISTPETGVDSIGATWALMDPLMTVIRPLSAFVTAFAAGIAVNLFGKDSTGPLDQPESIPEIDHGCCTHETTARAADEHDHDHEASGNLLQRALRYAFGTLLDDLTPWFLVGFAISGLIVVAVPGGFFTGTGLSGWTGMLTMLVAGVPLYICATASTPVAAAMMAKGLEPGAAMVLLLAGPATNVATILVVKNLLGKRTLILYLATIAIMSLAIGALVNRLYPMFGMDPTAMDIDPAAEHGMVSTLGGAVLGLLLLRSAWRLRLDRRLGVWLRKTGAPIGLDLTAWPIKIVAAALVVLGYAATAITAAGPGETVFIEEFGRVAQTRTTPGPLFHAPWPIARVRRVSTTQVHSMEFGVERLDLDDRSTDALALKEARAELKKIRGEAEMLTGEGWIVSIAYSIQYRVSDAETWIYGQSEPERMIRRLAQESIRQVAAKRTTEDILVGSDGDFRQATQSLLAESLRQADLGAELIGVELQSVHAPPAVHSAYRSVASALVERETSLIEAEARRIEKLSLARIGAAESIQKAESAAATRLSLAAATALAFRALAAVDAKYDGAIRQLMTLDAEKRAFTVPQRTGPQRMGVSRYFAASPHIRIIRRPAYGSPADGPRSELGRSEFGGNPFGGEER